MATKDKYRSIPLHTFYDRQYIYLHMIHKINRCADKCIHLYVSIAKVRF